MLAAGARGGLATVSVADVLKQAGVSRATFYEHFRNRDDCLLAAHRDLTAKLLAAVERIKRSSAVADPAREALLALLAAADEHPAAARLLGVDAFGATSEVRREQEHLMGCLEREAERLLSESPELRGSGLPTAALIGGVSGVISVRVFRGETGRLTDLANDLMSWARSYEMPPGSAVPDKSEWEELGARLLSESEPPPEPPPRKLPRGRSAIPAADAAAEQHRRIIDAVARLCRTKGYGAITVAELAAEAGVSRQVFYERFRGKEDAAMRALATVTQDSISTVAAEFFLGDDWPDRVWRGALSLLSYMSSREDLVALGMVEISAIGPDAAARTFDTRVSYTLFFEDGYRHRPEAESQPRICSEAVGGAFFEMTRQQHYRGRTRQMLEILPQLAFVGLAPFTGPPEALDLIRARCRGSS